jgi:hypothetical protein
LRFTYTFDEHATACVTDQNPKNMSISPNIPVMEFTAAVTMRIEEYNRLQEELEDLRATAKRNKKDMEILVQQSEKLCNELAVLKKLPEPDFEELWDSILASPELASLHRKNGHRCIWLVPTSGYPNGGTPEYRMTPDMRDKMGWPQYTGGLLTNKQGCYSFDSTASGLYRRFLEKFNVPAAAKPQPASAQSPNAAPQ